MPMTIPRTSTGVMRAAALLAVAGLLATPTMAAASRMTGSAVSPSIASDGVTGINAVLTNADGSLYDGPPVTVTFDSGCTSAGLAVLPPSATTVGGIASVTYRPQGCAGIDTVNVRTTGDGSLAATVQVFVTSRKALSAKGLAGRAMFFDTALSASGSMSCASCHAPSAGYLDPGAGPTPQGGVNGDAVGFRTAPSAAYAALIPRFAWAAPKPGGTVGARGTPHGGLMWDGRSATLAEQARGPFTEPHEMANASNAAVLQRLLTRPYLAVFSRAYGSITPASNPDKVVAQMADAIATFERQDPSFRLFTSKFDAALAGRASLTPQEQNGQSLFFAADKGGCAGCHSSNSAAQRKPKPELFSDGSFRALGVPRNWQLPYNDDVRAAAALAALGRSALANGAAAGDPNHVYFDLGLCGPFRTDALLDPGLCGAFRVPSLRNVALKHSYEHNGVFGSLAQVVDFYVNRELAPDRIYRTASGAADQKYNDLPTRFAANVQLRVPFRPFITGQPRLSPDQAKDVIAFLCTLTDGYDPANPEGYALPSQCRAAQR